MFHPLCSETITINVIEELSILSQYQPIIHSHTRYFCQFLYFSGSSSILLLCLINYFSFEVALRFLFYSSVAICVLFSCVFKHQIRELIISGDCARHEKLISISFKAHRNNPFHKLHAGNSENIVKQMKDCQYRI